MKQRKEITKRFGQVIACEGELAKVVIRRHSTCGDCGDCNNLKKVEVQNSCQAEVGDIVTLEIGGDHLLSAAILVYFLPLVGLIGGYFLGTYLGLEEVFRILMGGSFFVFFLGMARLKGQISADNYQVRMTEVIKSK